MGGIRRFFVCWSRILPSFNTLSLTDAIGCERLPASRSPRTTHVLLASYTPSTHILPVWSTLPPPFCAPSSLARRSEGGGVAGRGSRVARLRLGQTQACLPSWARPQRSPLMNKHGDWLTRVEETASGRGSVEGSGHGLQSSGFGWFGQTGDGWGRRSQLRADWLRRWPGWRGRSRPGGWRDQGTAG